MAIALGTSATDLRVGSSSISRMAKGGTAFWDADAADYVSRVQAADGEPLELGVVAAYHAFCLGCKDVGIWDAIQACCVMAGARTIAGALVPLKRPYGPELVDINALPTPTINNGPSGSSGQWDATTRTASNNVAGSNPFYPSFTFALPITNGKRYRVAGSLSGTGLSTVRLTTGAAGGGIAVSNNTFDAIVTAAGPAFMLTLNGTLSSSAVTIESLSIREDSFTPTAYPQPVNFVSGDYSRSLGLKGDGSTKYLDANRAANADGDTDHHIAAYMTQGTAVTGEYLIGAMTTAVSYTIAGYAMYSRAASAAGLADGGTGLYGVSRDGDASKFDYVKESGAVEQPARSAVAAVIGNSHSVFGYTRNDGVAIGLTPSRLSYYSIGSALDLAALDAKVSALMSQIAAALA